MLKVLVACECSGRVRDAFARRGWESWSADLLPSETEPQEGAHHYQGDCRDLFTRAWDLIIAHPPCTDLSYAGARWFREKQADGRQQAAADFFMDMATAPSSLVAVENPHSIMQKLYRPPDQVVEPWMFGDPYVKGIHLWLTRLPSLSPTHKESDYPAGSLTRAATGGGSWRTDKALNRARMSAYEDSEGRANRAKVRSRTFQGLAQAFADQWGAYAEDYYYHA